MIVVHGKGGHGRVIADAIHNTDQKFCFTDDADGTHPAPGEWFICGIGDNSTRKRIGGTANVVHPAAIIAVPSSCGQGNYIGAGAIVNPGCRIGSGCIINTGAIVEHDCRLGDYCHVAPGAVLCGGVEIGEGAFVGAGSVVKPGVKIGPWATIGCGSAVIRDIPAGETWAGNPARKLGE